MKLTEYFQGVCDFPRFHGSNLAYVIPGVLGTDLFYLQIISVDQTYTWIRGYFGVSCGEDGDAPFPDQQIRT